MAFAILVFVWTASRTVGPAIDGLLHHGNGADRVEAVALVLNVALIVFAWVRHKDAQQAMEESAAADQRAHIFQTRDAATNLLNRGCLRDRASAMIESARLDRGNVALMVINLKRFKKVNDTYGEPVGDALLQVIAAIVCGNVPRNALCARLGSDEFAVAVPFQGMDEEKILLLAEEIQAQLSLPMEIMGVSVKIGASIGLSSLAYDCGDFTSLLRRADLAMAHARANNSGVPVWFDAGMERALRARGEVEIGLQRGIPAGEFVPYFQPLVSFRTGEIEGFEMLARWHHPAGGVIGPEVFIPVAEETGMINDLSEVLMRAAFQEAANWRPELMLAVNVSPKQLMDPWFPHKLLKLLTETGFPATRLEVEITETCLMENLELAQSAVESIRSQGIRISLDDFGTGYSSLSHLRALPLDRIKIDQSFVLALTKDPESWTIVTAIAALGKTLGVAVTLEGVESAAIELRVRELGCETGQGWFYGQAAPAAKTRQLLVESGSDALPLGASHRCSDSKLGSEAA